MKHWFKPLLFAAAAVVLFFYNTGTMPLWSTDEGRHGEISREMWESKNFIIPQYFHVDYLEKPILSFALTALSIGTFGANSFAVRFVPAVSALLGILMIWFFTRRLLGSRAGEYAALMLLVTLGYVLVGRFGVIDMVMTFMLSGAFFSFMTAYFEKNRGFYLLAYVFMGFGFLTKGLIGIVLPGAAMGLFILINRDFREIMKMHIFPGILILCAIILPWWISATSAKPDFFRVFILEHHFSRFATKSFGRTKPFWFYAPVLLGACFPWSLLLPGAVRNVFKSEEKKKLLFLLCWAAVIFVFFSIPKSKLPYYLLPISMPVIVLCAAFVTSLEQKPRADGFARFAWEFLRVLGFIALPGTVIAAFLPIKDVHFETLKTLLPFGGVIISAGCLVSYYLYKKQRIAQSVLALSIMMGGLLLSVSNGMVRITPIESVYPEVRMIQKEMKPGDRVAIYSSPDDFSDLYFYLKERPLIVGTDRGTLGHESRKKEPQDEWFIGIEDFVKNFNGREKRYFFLIPEKRYDDVAQQNISGYRVLSRANKKVLLVNDAS